MNRKMVFYTIGQMLITEAVLLLLPTAVSVIYGEGCLSAFLITMGVALILGGLLMLLCRTGNQVIYAKEGFITVSLVWIAMSLVGALPFYISGEIPSYIDALFETVSGFTTTGATILNDVESMSSGLLFWRSVTHWVGGMGVLVFVMAIVPNMSDRSIHIMRAEVPGPTVGKLMPKIKDTAKILYIIYIALTVIEIVFLLIGRMPLFDSVVHAFGTAGTGGFGIKNTSIAEYSPYLQGVITVFMLLFGVNFNLFYLIILGKIKTALKSRELWFYLGLVAVCTVIIAVDILPLFENIGAALGTSVFQVSSFVTTTGYATADVTLWPSLSKGILFFLFFTGACAGSTAGGLKLSRIMILVKLIKKEFKHMLHPRSVSGVKFEGRQVEDSTLRSVSNYFAIYVVCFFIVFILISFEPFSLETNISAATSCFNNVGPIFSADASVANFSGYTGFSKLLLSFAMLLGRLEIFPLIIALSPSTWSKKG